MSQIDHFIHADAYQALYNSIYHSWNPKTQIESAAFICNLIFCCWKIMQLSNMKLVSR